MRAAGRVIPLPRPRFARRPAGYPKTVRYQHEPSPGGAVVVPAPVDENADTLVDARW